MAGAHFLIMLFFLLQSLQAASNFKADCLAALKPKTKLVNFEKDPGEVFFQIATDKTLLGHPSLQKLPHAQKSATTHRALMLVLRLNAQINMKSVIDFTSSDLPHFCDHTFHSVCGFVKPLKTAYLNSKSVFILQCSEWLKKGQDSWDTDFFPLNIFSYTDFCIGLHNIFHGLAQKKMLTNTDKVCDLVYTYLQELELFVRDQIIYLERYCSNSPFLANPDFKTICKRGLAAVPNLKAWFSDQRMTEVCSTAQIQRRKDCGEGSKCNYCGLVFSAGKGLITSGWNLLTGRMFQRQVTVQEVKILHTEALIETISHIMVSAAQKVLHEDDTHDGLSNEAHEAEESVRNAVAKANRNELIAKRIAIKVKDENAKEKANKS